MRATVATERTKIAPRSHYSVTEVGPVTRASTSLPPTGCGDIMPLLDPPKEGEATTGPEDAEQCTQRIYNVACGRSVSINELARMIIKITGSRSKVIHEAERSGDVKHSLADISKIRRELGFSPKTELLEGLERTVSRYQR